MLHANQPFVIVETIVLGKEGCFACAAETSFFSECMGVFKWQKRKANLRHAALAALRQN